MTQARCRGCQGRGEYVERTHRIFTEDGKDGAHASGCPVDRLQMMAAGQRSTGDRSGDEAVRLAANAIAAIAYEMLPEGT